MTLAWNSSSPSSPYRMQDVRSSNEAPLGGAQVLTPDGRSLPLASAKLRVEAGGGLARVVLEQTFENPYDDTLRVTYKMPLPVDGAVSGYAFRVGTRTITGKVDRKESARTRFEQAIASGKTAALLEQEKADIFTQDIGNIPPRQTIVAEITIDQRLAWTAEGQWELRFPTVIGPRYLAASLTPEDRRASHVELADAGGVRGRVHLEIRIADAITEGGRVESPSHSLNARFDGAIELADLEGARLDRDVVVRWPVAKREVGLGLQVARPQGGANGRHAYALLSIVPPAPDAGHAAVPRDLIVLLDTSGSMDGPPLEKAKRVVASLIDSLSEQDRLEVVEFSTRPNRYSKSPLPGTRREKEKVIHWVMQRRASGGTEMQSAIMDALHGLRPGAQRQVVLVTDGYVGGEQQIVTMLHESLPESCRMHVVGVGSAANRNLATSLARAGRGAEVLVGLDEDAERSAKALIDKTRAPVLTDLVIGGSALVQCAPEHMPDVFAGAPVLAALNVLPQGGEIVVRGNLARGTWEQRITVPASDPGDGNQAIVKLYGRESVADLEMRWTIGNEVQSIDRQIESIGLVFQIATRKTSWLAIDDDRSVDPRLGSRHEEIPQELPYGTTFGSYGSVQPQAAAMGYAMQELAAPRSVSLSRPSSVPPAARMMPRPAAGRPMPPAERDDAEEALSITASSRIPSFDEGDVDESRTLAGGYPPRSEEPDTLRPPPPGGRPMIEAARSPSPLPPPPQQQAPQAAQPPMAPMGMGAAPPPAPRSAPSRSAPSYAPLPQILMKGETMPHLAPPPPPKRSNTWLIALVIGLAFLVVVLAAILGWLLLLH